MRYLSIGILAAVSMSSSIDLGAAADLPTKAPIAPANVGINWTGFYVGANVGGGRDTRNVDYLANDPGSAILFTIPGARPPALSFKDSGAVGGLQLGYNWQFNRNWLIGVETDFDWSGIKGSQTGGGIIAGVAPFATSNDERLKWFGTVRGRFGFLPVDSLLVYATGGFAYGRVEHNGNYTNTSSGATLLNSAGGFGFLCSPGQTCFSGSSSERATGWTLGGGLEYAFWTNWTLKAEYLYLSLEGKSLTESAPRVFISGDIPSSLNTSYSRINLNIGRVGLNYRF